MFFPERVVCKLPLPAFGSFVESSLVSRVLDRLLPPPALKAQSSALLLKLNCLVV